MDFIEGLIVNLQKDFEFRGQEILFAKDIISKNPSGIGHPIFVRERKSFIEVYIFQKESDEVILFQTIGEYKFVVHFTDFPEIKESDVEDFFDFDPNFLSLRFWFEARFVDNEVKIVIFHSGTAFDFLRWRIENGEWVNEYKIKKIGDMSPNNIHLILFLKCFFETCKKFDYEKDPSEIYEILMKKYSR